MTDHDYEDSNARDLAEEARSVKEMPGYGTFDGTPPYKCDECGSGDPAYHHEHCSIRSEP